MMCIFCGGEMDNIKYLINYNMHDHCYFMTWGRGHGGRRNRMGSVSFQCCKKNISGAVGGPNLKKTENFLLDNDLLNKGFKI